MERNGTRRSTMDHMLLHFRPDPGFDAESLGGSSSARGVLLHLA